MSLEKAYSYGIIPVVKEGESFFVALVKNISGDHWGFPKGTPDEGENPFQTARRELKEETGVSVSEVVPGISFEESYIVRGKEGEKNKTNTYFISFLKEKINLKPELSDVLECGWFSFNEAKEKLTYAESKKILDDIKSFLKA